MNGNSETATPARTGAAPSSAPSTTRIVIFAIIVIVVGVSIYFRQSAQSEPRTVTGAITAIEGDRVTARVPHPKTGQPIELSTTLAPNCPITLDGRPISLADLRIGDRISADGSLVRGSGRIVVHAVRVERAAASAPAASAPVESATP